MDESVDILPSAFTAENAAMSDKNKTPPPKPAPPVRPTPPPSPPPRRETGRTGTNKGTESFGPRRQK